MARRWVNLVGVTPLLLGMIVAVPQMVVAPLVLAQTSQNSQETEAQRLYNEGEQLRQQGTRESFPQALDRFQQALTLFRATRNRRQEAVTLSNIGLVSSNIGQPQQALNSYQQALPIFREVGDRSGEADTLGNIGNVYRDIGQLPQALSYLRQALQIVRELRPRREQNPLGSLPLTFDNLGQTQSQPVLTRPPLTLGPGGRSVRCRSDASTRNQYSCSYEAPERPSRIREPLVPTILPRYWTPGDRPLEARILRDISIVHSLQGPEYSQQAWTELQQALLLTREVNDRSGEATTLNNIGELYSSIRQPQQALNYYQQALLIRRELHNRFGEATTLNGIGEAYLAIGQSQEALDSLQSLQIRREEVDNHIEEEVRTINPLGIVRADIIQSQQALNYYHQALDNFQEALTIKREVGDRSGEARTLYNLAFTQRTLNNLPEALQNIQAATQILETIRGNLINPDDRTTYFATVQSYYKFQIDLLMQLHQQNPNQGYNIQAFNTTERSKARTLIELLTESKADIRNGVDPQLLQQEKDLQTQISALEKRRRELGNTGSTPAIRQEITNLDQQQQTLQTQYQELQTKIRQTNPKYADIQYPQPLTLKQIQQQILDDNTVILSYSLGKDKSYLWLISKTEMTSYELPNQKIIEDLVNNNKARSELTNPRTSRDSFLSGTSQLANILLKPIQDKIGNKRLAIINDGALHYVPFGALPDPRAEANQYQPLLVNNEIIYLPSATSLQSIRNETKNRPTPPQTLAVMADPVFSTNDDRISQGSRPAPNPTALPLTAQNLETAARGARGDNWNRIPYTRQEADTILSLVPENSRLAYFGFDANRANAQNNQLSQYRFIHWATHGFADPKKQEVLGIVMSLVNQTGEPQNGYLLLGDIFNLSFNADLVVLSACETGRGAVTQGEGLIGMTRGLMYAGTPRVVTSLWSVNDAETATLMGKFYEKMLKQNLKPAEALRAAQLEMFRSRPWMAPYYWAAFTLQGEWR